MKMKEFGPRGPRPCRPLPPANSCTDVTDIVKTVRLQSQARARSHGANFLFTTAIYFIAGNGLCGGLYKCSDRFFSKIDKIGNVSIRGFTK